MGPLALAEQEQTAAERQAQHEKAKHASSARAAARASGSAPAPAAQAEAPDQSTDEEEESSEDAAKPSANKGNDPGFVGLFAGKDVAVFRIEGLPDRQELDDRAHIRIESAGMNSLHVVLVNSDNGSDLCVLEAKVEGSSASLQGAQPCFTSEDEGAIHAQVTSGTLVLNGDRLRLDAEGAIQVTLADQELEGDLTYSFKGDRQ